VRRIAIVGCVLVLAIAASAQLTGKFTIEKSRYSSGEPIYLQFEVTNTQRQTVFFEAGSPYSFCGGYQLQLNEGGALRNPSCSATGSGGGSCRSATHSLRYGVPERERVLLNYQDDLRRPGSYHLKATRYIRWAPTDDLIAMIHGISEKFESEFDIEITAPDEAKLRGQLAPYLADLKSPNEERMDEAARVLASAAPTFLEPTMLAMLHDDWLGHYAIEGLRRINTPTAREAVARIAETYMEKYSSQAELAVESLSEMGDRKYFPMLQHIVDSKPPNTVGETVRYAARLGGEQAIPWLGAMLRSPNPQARSSAVFALADTGSRKAVPMLIDLLLSSDQIVPSMAENALVKLTHRSVAPEKYQSGTPAAAHDRWMQWWLAHNDAAVYGPKECGEILPLE
jgi:hypothetical protein